MPATTTKRELCTNAERVMDELKRLPVEELRRERVAFSRMSRTEYLTRRREQRLQAAQAAAERARSSL